MRVGRDALALRMAAMHATLTEKPQEVDLKDLEAFHRRSFSWTQTRSSDSQSGSRRSVGAGRQLKEGFFEFQCAHGEEGSQIQGASWQAVGGDSQVLLWKEPSIAAWLFDPLSSSSVRIAQELTFLDT